MITFNNIVLNVDGKWIRKVDPLNPLNLPANTIRCRFVEGYTPTCGDTQTLVRDNIWDIYKAGDDWSNLFNEQPGIDETHLIEVLGANTTDVTYMMYMFNRCTSLTSVALFDTSNVITMWQMFGYCSSLTSVPLFNTANVTAMYAMFWSCSSLTSVPLFDTSSAKNMSYMLYKCNRLKNIPLFDTSSVTNMDSMCEQCRNVESGALALYQQASTQADPPRSHSKTFSYCGDNTTTGYAELSQIPSDWK